VGIVPLGQLPEELLQVLLYCLQPLQLRLRGGVEGNLKNFSLMYLVSDLTKCWICLTCLMNRSSPLYICFQLRRIQKSIWGSLKGFHYENYKLQQIVLATKTFWVGVDLGRFTKDVWQMVHW
jgi:hypothetical protein